MKSGILCWLFLFTAVQVNALHRSVSVLFIGNSYTAVNNLPLLLDSIAASGGDTVVWDMVAPGGYTLKMHAADTNTINKIRLRSWDYVVLQEQSQLPSLDPDSVDSTTVPYSLYLDSLIRANDSCTQIVFYETWGRKYGDTSNCAAYPPVCTYDGMQQRLMESYKLMADTCHAIVAPVGEAFRTCIAFDSTVNLYQADESHPSLNGSFLAASVFYNVFFHRNANGIAYDPGVTQLPAYMFHLFARQIVKDSLNYWNIGIYEPWAEFSWNEAPGCYGEFFGNSNANFNHFWDFGDSTTSTDPNPVHLYLHPRYYPVTHIVYNACNSDTFRLTNNIGCSGDGIDESTAFHPELSPNPAREIIAITNLPASKLLLTISDSMGRMLMQIQTSGPLVEFSVASLPEGIYFLQMTDGSVLFPKQKLMIAR